MQIGSNSASLMAVNALNSANAVVLKASERISTGLRINRASDDPTGLMAANRFKTQITSMAKAASCMVWRGNPVEDLGPGLRHGLLHGVGQGGTQFKVLAAQRQEPGTGCALLQGVGTQVQQLAAEGGP